MFTTSMVFIDFTYQKPNPSLHICEKMTGELQKPRKKGDMGKYVEGREERTKNSSWRGIVKGTKDL